MSPWTRKSNLTRDDVIDILENFLSGKKGRFSWDGFTLGMSFDDPFLEEIRIRSANLGIEFPPNNQSEYTNEAGRSVLRSYISQLRDWKQ